MLRRWSARHLFVWGNVLLLPFSVYLFRAGEGQQGLRAASKSPTHAGALSPPSSTRPERVRGKALPWTSGVCDRELQQVQEGAAALRALLTDKGTLSVKFRLATPDAPAVSERVSPYVARVLAQNGGLALPHSVECRGGICKVVVVRPPEHAFNRYSHPSPCTSTAMEAVMAHSWTWAGVAVFKREPMTGRYSWEDECFVKVKDRL
jgi:hypothetical protein